MEVAGLFNAGNFPQLIFGFEGNEHFNRFTGPNFNESDVALLKNTAIGDGVAFQFRFEVFNVLNRHNLTNMDTNLPDGNFGQATGQLGPRFIQLGGNLTF